MSEMTLFEIATRANFTFQTSRGLVTTSDLWTLPLLSKKGPCLNDVAVQLDVELNQLGAKTFVSSNDVSPQRREAQHKLDVVLRIIEVREAEQAKALDAKKNADRRAKLLEALEVKKEESILNMSEEELRAQLASLDQANA